MGTTTASGFYIPSHLESGATWESPIGAGLQAHEDFRSHVARTVPFRKVYVNDDYGSDSNNADAIGRPDYPYKTLAAALAAIPNGGNIGLTTGTHLILQGSNAVTSGNPTQKYSTGGATLQLPSYLILEGAGADADRSRASCLIEDTVGTGPLLDWAGRYIELRKIGVRNLSTSVGSCGVQAAGISGGMQSMTMDQVHVYGSRQGVILKSFNVDSSRFTQCQFSNNRLEGLVCQTNGTDAPNQLFFLSCEISQNNTDVVAGTPNVRMIADEGGSHNAYFLMPKIHGFSTRFDIQGWNNLWIQGGYFETGSNGYGGLYDDASIIKVSANPNGSTEKYWAHGIHVIGNRFHSPHGGVPANWSANVGVVSQVDGCYGYEFRDNICDDNVDIDATNPAHRLGANVRNFVHSGNQYIAGSSRIPQTNPSAIYSRDAAMLPYNFAGSFSGDCW